MASGVYGETDPGKIDSTAFYCNSKDQKRECRPVTAHSTHRQYKNKQSR